MRWLHYADAVRLLGGPPSGALAWDELLAALRGLDHTERLCAAHVVIAVTAYAEAVPVEVHDSAVPLPSPASREALAGQLETWYEGLGAERAAARRAVERYEELQRRLAAEVPEFGLWLQLTEPDGEASGLRRLENLLRVLGSERAVDDRRGALAAAYRAALDEPILRRAGAQFPALGTMYIDPVFRARAAEPGDRPSEEGWWADVPVRDDLAGFLAGYLMSPDARVAPLAILGQPGAGKSALTAVLAARLPPSAFLPVRVPLREVPADVDLQDQIEHALRGATGERIGWPELSRSAGGALPLVLLDGFDELLQATGVNQSDFLERVAAFQYREAVQGRPVAVVVTSRVAVADRARLPEGALVVRLEPFTEPQIERWLATWNAANEPALRGRGLRPLPPAAAHRFRELASQPLLLLMLALYDAQDNEVQRLAADELDAGELYERLLRSFAEREVRRGHPAAPDTTIAALVESELMRLSVAAFAMFNRSQLWITEAELDADLAVLSAGAEPAQPPAAGFRAPLTAGQDLVGRFFFIQRAQAVRDGEQLQTFEFLHATFGEYLVARLLIRLLHDLAAREAAATLPLRTTAADDALLYALLSFSPLTSRGTVLRFAASAVTEPSDRQRLQALTVRTFRAALRWTTSQPSAYQPVALPLADRHALYTLNLLLAAVTFGEVTASALFPEAPDPVNEWRRCLQRWQAAVDGYGWFSVASTVEATRIWHGTRRDLVLRAADVPAVEPVEGFWIHAIPADSRDRDMSGFRFEDHDLIQQTYQLRGEPIDDILRHALEPLLETMGLAVTSFGVLSEDRSQSAAHSLLKVWITTSLDEAPGEQLVDAFDAAVRVVTGSYPLVERPIILRSATVLLRMLSREADRLPHDDVVRWCRTLYREGSHCNATIHLLLLDCLLTARLSSPAARALFDELQAVGHDEPAPDPRLSRRVAAALVETGLLASDD
ncbi:hypothetical protein KZZ52_24360 [Dactylosporangium sp. AC04546]|uniref:NACHT domain-containing protein n=1 Tax=Dactylosporangium sp. AC04546 TaxID=2862460 RepID=UPI001EDEEBC2|nr:hypothetical protein [Dactylosporangium sp. AC04546]WVK88409.1 hypothetical protein KZZ52_24360 [Dactylosporangium sp. AC04546]